MNSINKQTTSFELSRFNKSGNALSPITNSSSNGALTSRNLIQSRQTSTPLLRPLPWQKNNESPSNQTRSPTSILSRSPRYSLSSLSQKSISNDSPVKPTIQTVTGPLLASTRFNVNLSRSPGLASRVVQYHNELSGNQSSTHQAKYGSPGQFPIVQLYKKELPILNRSTRRCTVRIAPPDPVSYNSDHANTILRDSFIQRNVENTNHQSDTEINTRSVLEALKEISRKRIHTNDDTDDISKRQRKNSVSSPNNPMQLNKDGKRMREDTPPKPKETLTTSVSNASKRICVVDEIESSLSSSRLMRMNQGQKRKSSLIIPETSKQRRMSNGELVSKETQTSNSNDQKSEATPQKKEKQKTTSTAAQTETELACGMLDIDTVLNKASQMKRPTGIRTIQDIDEENSTLHLAKTVNTTPTRAFCSEAPLQILKQNKLEVMLSALGGYEPKIIPLPDLTLSALKKRTADSPEGTDVVGKAVVSILSPKNKTKHDKHVTFAIPNSEDTNDGSSLKISSKSNENINNNLPVVSATTSNIPISNADSLKQNISFSAGNFPTTPLQFDTSSLQTTASSLTFSPVCTAVSNISSTSNSPGNNFMFATSFPSNKINFNTVTSTTNSTNIITSSSINNMDSSNKNVTSFGTPTSNFNFGSPNTLQPLAFGGLVPSNINTVSEKPQTNNESTTLSSTPTTGFQFPLVSVTSSSNTPVVFGSTTSNTSSVKDNISSQSVVNFGTKSSDLSTITTNIVTTVTKTLDTTNNQPKQPLFFPNTTTITPAISTSGSTDMFNFSPKSEPKTTTSSNFTFGTSNSSIQAPSKSGGFKFNLGKSVATTSASSSKTDPAKNLFGSSNSSDINKSNTLTFGVPKTATTSSSGFNTPSSTTSIPAFGIQSTNTPSFGTANKIVTSGMFGIPTSTNTGVFGASNTTSASNVFGTTSTSTTSSGFGVPNNTLSTGTFGTPVSTTNTTVFGSSNNTSVNADIFGSSTSLISTKPPESTSSFNTFGTPVSSTNNPVFGSSNTTSTAGIFGNSSSLTSEKSSENMSGFNAFNSAGPKQNSGFGTSAQNPNFGFATVTTTQSNVFGSATTTSTFTFGSNTSTKAFSFGPTTTATTTSSMFGSTNTVAPSNLFGGNASSGFGSPSVAPNTFGPPATTAQNTFGQSSTNVFGASSSGFGSGTTGSMFNTSTNNNNFGSSAAPNVFGSSGQQPNTFGTSTSNQGNIFGMNNNDNNQGSGVFGATNVNNTFGSTGNTSFGSGFTNNNAQGSGINNFGSTSAPNQTAGVFAFGSTPQSSSSAPSASNAFQFGAGNQTPKPSGFNFSANTNTPNINFGSGTASSFNATPTPAFGNPVLGQFNTAPATGMFNIGSGSTAPKQRPMIKARRRN